jgi:hypothetical protein
MIRFTNTSSVPTSATTVKFTLVDRFTRQRHPIGSRVVPPIPGFSQESLLAADTFDVPPGLLISIFKQGDALDKHERGLYLLEACADSPTGGNPICRTTPTPSVTLNSSCFLVSPLDPIPDSEGRALELERARPNAPPYFTTAQPSGALGLQLTLAVSGLINHLNAACPTCRPVEIESGFRPLAYTQHAWDLSETLKLLTFVNSCPDLLAAIETHIAEHGFLMRTTSLGAFSFKTLVLNRPGKTQH